MKVSKIAKSKGNKKDAVNGMENKLKPGRGDIAHAVVKVALSTIPAVGGAAAEFFSAIVIPPISKRRGEWIESIYRELKKLEQRISGFDIKTLSKNNVFITTLTNATQIAIRNHQREKLEALRNAVLNASLPNSLEENFQLMFLSFIDIFVPWHLRILKFFDNPQKWGGENRDYISKVDNGHSSNSLRIRFP